MPVTKGHANPDWTWDETILALDLYLTIGRKTPGHSDSKIKALSRVLQSLPLHPPAKRGTNFRNASSVAFKLLNFKNVETGKGLKNTSKIDKIVFPQYCHQPDLVSQLAKQIQLAGHALPDVMLNIDEVEAEHEGSIVYRLHRARERRKDLRPKKLAQARALGTLTCEACGEVARPPLGPTGEAIFEIHHRIPLSHSGKVGTKLKDLSILCATCHRLIHALSKRGDEFPTVEDLKSLLSK